MDVAKITLQEWIEKSTLVHNGFYDYSLISELSTKQKVKIICPSHGIFEQSIYTHVKGQSGCKLCRSQKISNSKTLTTDEFIKKAKSRYGDLYDYSSAEYTKGMNFITIICPVHGEFRKRAEDHLNNKSGGCPFCGNESTSEKLKQTPGEFKIKSILIHKNKYHYNNVHYVNSKQKVSITCKIHGDFLQKPQNHIQGNGCPKCVRNYNGAGFIYLMKCELNENVYKIGHSVDPKRRNRELLIEFNNNKSPYKLKLIKEYEVQDRGTIEKLIHQELRQYKIDCSGFEGSSEMFECNINIIMEVFKKYI